MYRPQENKGEFDISEGTIAEHLSSHQVKMRPKRGFASAGLILDKKQGRARKAATVALF